MNYQFFYAKSLNLRKAFTIIQQTATEFEKNSPFSGR